jgi:hypothetical protein
MGCNEIILSSDCMEVIIMMQDGGNSYCLARLIDDCYDLATDFPKVLFEYCNHETNSVAHEPTRIARGSS